MNSGIYPARAVRLNRPRTTPGDKSVQLAATVPAALKVTALREADAEGVSLSYVIFEGVRRQCSLSYDARENGLLPIPARISEEELSLCESAAKAMGMQLERWFVHAALALAADRKPPENNTASSVTQQEALTGEDEKAAA